MDITGFVAMSHAPHWSTRFDHSGPGDQYVGAVARARARVDMLRPDALVVFGPDHFRNFFFDTMPAFCLGVDKVEAVGDYNTPKGPLPGFPQLGQYLIDAVSAQGFDPAISLHMGVDHGIAQAYAALAGDSGLPVVPVMINCSGAAMASMRRCFDFGRAVGRAIREAPLEGSVVVVGSGGLSHSPGSGSPYDPTLSNDRRDYIINGRSRMVEYSAARDAMLARYIDAGVTGPINEEWDQWFLGQLASGDVEPLLRMTSEEVLRDGGTGGQEVRAWMAAFGAWDGPVAASTYEPVPTWITGMGCVAAG